MVTQFDQKERINVSLMLLKDSLWKYVKANDRWQHDYTVEGVKSRAELKRQHVHAIIRAGESEIKKNIGWDNPAYLYNGGL